MWHETSSHQIQPTRCLSEPAIAGSMPHRAGTGDTGDTGAGPMREARAGWGAWGARWDTREADARARYGAVAGTGGWATRALGCGDREAGAGGVACQASTTTGMIMGRRR